MMRWLYRRLVVVAITALVIVGCGETRDDSPTQDPPGLRTPIIETTQPNRDDPSFNTTPRPPEGTPVTPESQEEE